MMRVIAYAFLFAITACQGPPTAKPLAEHTESAPAPPGYTAQCADPTRNQTVACQGAKP